MLSARLTEILPRDGLLWLTDLVVYRNTYFKSLCWSSVAECLARPLVKLSCNLVQALV